MDRRDGQIGKERKEQMRINGEEKNGYIGCSIEEMLEKEAYQRSRVAVERNGQIVPKSDYAKVLLQAEDTVEVVSFVGGG